MTQVSMIVAVAQNGVIGKDGTLPWRIPEDLKAFKELTANGILYVGKKTAQSLPPLKGREVVILNRHTYPTLTDIKLNETARPLWIIGGAEIYQAALELNIVDRAFITTIHTDYEGDTYFSVEQFKAPKWKLISEKDLTTNEPRTTIQEWHKEA